MDLNSKTDKESLNSANVGNENQINQQFTFSKNQNESNILSNFDSSNNASEGINVVKSLISASTVKENEEKREKCSDKDENTNKSKSKQENEKDLKETNLLKNDNKGKEIENVIPSEAEGLTFQKSLNSESKLNKNEEVKKEYTEVKQNTKVNNESEEDKSRSQSKEEKNSFIDNEIKKNLGLSNKVIVSTNESKQKESNKDIDLKSSNHDLLLINEETNLGNDHHKLKEEIGNNSESKNDRDSKSGKEDEILESNPDSLILNNQQDQTEKLNKQNLLINNEENDIKNKQEINNTIDEKKVNEMNKDIGEMGLLEKGQKSNNSKGIVILNSPQNENSKETESFFEKEVINKEDKQKSKAKKYQDLSLLEQKEQDMLVEDLKQKIKKIKNLNLFDDIEKSREQQNYLQRKFKEEFNLKSALVKCSLETTYVIENYIISRIKKLKNHKIELTYENSSMKEKKLNRKLLEKFQEQSVENALKLKEKLEKQLDEINKIVKDSANKPKPQKVVKDKFISKELEEEKKMKALEFTKKVHLQQKMIKQREEERQKKLMERYGNELLKQAQVKEIEEDDKRELRKLMIEERYNEARQKRLDSKKDRLMKEQEYLKLKIPKYLSPKIMSHEIPELEKKKLLLKQKRNKISYDENKSMNAAIRSKDRNNNYKNINNSKYKYEAGISEEAEETENFEREEAENLVQNNRDIIITDKNKFKSIFSERIIQMDKEEKEKARIKNEQTKGLKDRQKAYGEIVKNAYMPNISEKKAEELQKKIENLKHPVLQPKDVKKEYLVRNVIAQMKNRPSSINQGNLTDQEKNYESITPPSNNTDENYHKNITRSKDSKFLKENVEKKENAPKKIDYLVELKNQRLNNPIEPANWIDRIQKSNMNAFEKIEKVNIQAAKIEEQAKMKEKYVKYNPNTDQAANMGGEIADMYVDAIKAKLAIFNNLE